jgi:hypothetical protein
MLGTFGDLVGGGVAPPRFCFLRRCLRVCLLCLLYLGLLYVLAIIYSMLLKNIQKYSFVPFANFIVK